MQDGKKIASRRNMKNHASSRAYQDETEEGRRSEGGGVGQGGEMTQTTYAHVNK
jgi:hypothetical protein